MNDNYEKIAKDLAEAHVSWFLETLRPLLISHMTHGFKHGYELEHSVNMVGDFFEGNKKERFELWLKKVVGRDDRFKHLLESDYKEERLDFYNYFIKRLSPWQALQEEYRKYG